MEWARDIALILTAVGAGAFFPKIVDAVIAAVTGRPARQRREVERLRDVADDEAFRRRIAQEYASHLRRLLFGAPCVRVEDIPPWPDYERRESHDDSNP